MISGYDDDSFVVYDLEIYIFQRILPIVESPIAVVCEAVNDSHVQTGISRIGMLKPIIEPFIPQQSLQMVSFRVPIAALAG